MKWNELFDMINKEVETNGCNTSFSQRDNWLDANFEAEMSESLKTIFNATGGHCLCETLMNSAYVLEEDEEIPNGGKSLAENMLVSMENTVTGIKRHLEVFMGKTDKRIPFHDLKLLLDILVDDIKAIKVGLPEMAGDGTTYDVRAFDE